MIDTISENLREREIKRAKVRENERDIDWKTERRWKKREFEGIKKDRGRNNDGESGKRDRERDIENDRELEREKERKGDRERVSEREKRGERMTVEIVKEEEEWDRENERERKKQREREMYIYR